MPEATHGRAAVPLACQLKLRSRFSFVMSSGTIGVNFDDTVSDQPCAGCIGIGPYLVELGVLAQV